MLWEEGVKVFDSYSEENFCLCAMLFCTINDFPAYGNLSCYSVKGHFACPICEENTSYLQLNHGQKTVYTRHRRFLPRNHPYRRLKKAFNGRPEDDVVCRPHNGEEVYAQVPQGYSSNISSLVSMKDLKLVGLKYHDCHVLIKQLLPVAIRAILPASIRGILTRLSLFFNAICKKVVDPLQLDDLQNEAIRLLCQLEMYFPPSFFDIMVHLIVHQVREIRICGLVFLRWMYPVERYMKILKGYVKNQLRPEASIIERYIAEEFVEFCSSYMPSCDPIGLPKKIHESRPEGKGVRGVRIESVSGREVNQAHLYILNNTEDVIPYISQHIDEIKSAHPHMSEKWTLNEHNKSFLAWFKKKIYATPKISENLLRLAHGPNTDVITFGGYYINNYLFYSKEEDDKSRVQNSGVTLQAEALHFSSSNDKNPITASISYFGIIQEIWEIDYLTFRVPVFKCKWVDSNSGVVTEDLGFTLVDLYKMIYTDEPFIMENCDIPNDERIRKKILSHIVKRMAAQQRQNLNDTPHVLSRGGYVLLEKKMRKRRVEELGLESPDLLPPPAKHELWKAAQTKSNGQFPSQSVMTNL
ncbi:uncharacterized protein LOC124845689 [Vigna umbellata]|uniref:uncharacterized protein LOC124845689 n=1 Tax=Vigna umbellata TaxID=87088 RepID=UPI001F5FAA35|nr:uncharacterized protein LOC124845689 [Vigna umbellata]